MLKPASADFTVKSDFLIINISKGFHIYVAAILNIVHYMH